MMRKDKWTIESALHALAHFFGVLMLFWVAIVPPIWVALGLIVLEQAQIKLFGNCFLTRLAHSRGIMVGMSYWEYIPYMFGVKNYKQAKVAIDGSIKLALATILVVRVGLLFWKQFFV
jgi:hypothetical protein